MQDLYELKDKLLSELKSYAKKDKLDAASLQIVDTLCHSLKNLCKVIEDKEMEMDSYGYSQAAMPRMPRMSYDYDMSYARGRGPYARRDSMGRYSSRDGGGYSTHGDFRMEMQEMMNNAPNEQVRQKMMEAMNMM